MADDKFRLPGSSYEELVKIIRAYSHTSGPAAPAEVGEVIGMNQTIVSRNNGFLLGAGIVEGGNKKNLTVQGLQLARALDHQMADEITTQWRATVERTEFLQRILAAVRIRNGMEPATLQSHVAYTAGQPNKGTVKTGSATVVEILKTAQVLEERDGKLYAVTEGGPLRDETPEAGAPAETTAAVRRRDVPSVSQLPVLDLTTPPGVAVQIRVNVSCTVDELPALGENLGRLLRDLPKLGTPPVDDSAE